MLNRGRPSETRQLKVRGKQTPPKKPKDLKGVYANQLWDEAVAALEHVLRPVDFAVLRLACEAFQLAVTSEVPKERLSAGRCFDQLAGKIGLNPLSRRVIKPVEPETESKGETVFEEWLKRGGLN